LFGCLSITTSSAYESFRRLRTRRKTFPISQTSLSGARPVVVSFTPSWIGCGRGWSGSAPDILGQIGQGCVGPFGRSVATTIVVISSGWMDAIFVCFCRSDHSMIWEKPASTWYSMSIGSEACGGVVYSELDWLRPGLARVHSR
jgi:hypothetical protein